MRTKPIVLFLTSMSLLGLGARHTYNHYREKTDRNAAQAPAIQQEAPKPLEDLSADALKELEDKRYEPVN